jgi:hypothetical protein
MLRELFWRRRDILIHHHLSVHLGSPPCRSSLGLIYAYNNVKIDGCFRFTPEPTVHEEQSSPPVLNNFIPAIDSHSHTKPPEQSSPSNCERPKAKRRTVPPAAGNADEERVRQNVNKIMQEADAEIAASEQRDSGITSPPKKMKSPATLLRPNC